MARIFLCHASEDKAKVREVYHQLKTLRFEPWLDEMNILPGQDWNYEIEQALETSDFVMVFLSTRSVEKIGYVQREFRRALYCSEEWPEGFIHTIPVKLDDCSVPHRFVRYQWINLYESGAFDRIIRALHYGLQQRGQPLPDLLAQEPSSTQLGMEPKPSIFTNSISYGQRHPVTPRRLVIPEPAPIIEQTESLPDLHQRHTTSTASTLPQVRVRVSIPGEQSESGHAQTLRNIIGMEFVLILPGEFLMGAGKDQRKVRISQPFYLGKYPVTQGQWKAVMGKTKPFRAGSVWGTNFPVNFVTWSDVQKFIQALNTKENGALYRLPTEAEWEYAARAGSTTMYCFGDDHKQLREYAWYKKNSRLSKGSYATYIHEVGQKKPNTWGLYDIHGNVWEWVEDQYEEPTWSSYRGRRVLRGGSHSDDSERCRLHARRAPSPDSRNSPHGFRLLRKV